MEKPRLDFAEVQLRPVPPRVGAPMMEKRPAPAFDLGHDIRVGGRCFAGGAQKSRVDPVFLAILQDALPQRVATDQTGGEKRRSAPQPGEINQDVVRRATAALRLAANVRQLFGLRVNINQLDLVDDSVESKSAGFWSPRV